MFDSGGIPDSQFKGDGPATEGIMSATKRLLPQLKEAGYTPADITYFAMSHYHSDHTANANAFASATWIVQKAERDFMFADKPEGIIQPAQYSALKGAKTHDQACFAQPAELKFRCTSPGCSPIQYIVDRCPAG